MLITQLLNLSPKDAILNPGFSLSRRSYIYLKENIINNMSTLKLFKCNRNHLIYIQVYMIAQRYNLINNNKTNNWLPDQAIYSETRVVRNV